VKAIERLEGKLLAWAIALGLCLCLLGLLVATGESIRPAEIASPFTETVEPELPLQSAPIDKTYHHPAFAAWMTP
jgi:hypothetical protein